ncbi:ion channel protein [Planctomonas sp. JC2975]|uniref:ion channel protein n=1 Tax=Planctomonas sp. JC2975 TaxID=2729626 RepID=UPI00147630AE|nr:ion channel protein [Planctomonas sp. JC2975]
MADASAGRAGAAEEAGPSIRTLLLLAIPALLIGIASAVVLWLLDLVSGWLESAIWDGLPHAIGITSDNPWWILVVLTFTGFAVGLVVWLVPGHGGPDSATTGLSSPPPPIGTLPSIGIVVLISLAGGVSLGPENPIIAINGALAVAAFARFATKIPPLLIITLATSGTIGALFGTPVAAALVLTGTVAAVRNGGSLWDKLFLPVAAAAAGAETMHLLGGQTIAFHLPPYGTPNPIDFLTGLLVAAFSAGIGILAAFLFPYLHAGFHALRHPVLLTTAGGLLLGLLGIVGGPITLFKGLEQTGELLAHPGDYSAGMLAVFVIVKVVALLVAASSGFRGGRVFPAVFIGVAIGLLGHAVIPGIPLGLAVACGALGIVLVETRDGWIALFLGVALTGDLTLLSTLCVIVLPVWLLVTKAPHFEIEPKHGLARPPTALA